MKIKVLFVCLGNICRSTMAEGVFRNLVEKENLSDVIFCDSAGTANYHIGSKADHRTLKVLNDNGIELNHRGRQINISDFDEFDYILAMDANNFKDINYLYQKSRKPKSKVMMMREFEGKSTLDVPDPYYGDLNDFVEVFDIVTFNSNELLKHIKSNLKI